jgi:hypothetical protein
MVGAGFHQHDTTDPVERVLARLHGVRRSGKGYEAKCPAHDDHHASLSIGHGDDGRALVYCHVGCETEDILAAIGLTMADLFSESQRRNGYADSRFSRPSNSTGREKRENEKAEKPPRREARRVKYEIRECDGSLAGRHVRIEYDDGSKDFKWEGPDGRMTLDGRDIETMPLYRSEDLAALPDGATVVVCEGEKATLAVLAAGLNAVGTVTGAKKAPSADVLKCLARFDVVLWPDNDDAGRSHMHVVAERLLSMEAQP